MKPQMKMYNNVCFGVILISFVTLSNAKVENKDKENRTPENQEFIESVKHCKNKLSGSDVEGSVDERSSHKVLSYALKRFFPIMTMI
jgi:hypothetical protein